MSKLIIGTLLTILVAAPAQADVSVSAAYNNKTKSVAPVVTLSHKVGKVTYSAWTKFSKGATTPAIHSGEIYVAEAAFTIQDAKERFGIVSPSNFTLPDVSGSLYSWDGGRVDGAPISGQTVDGTFVKASRTLVTADKEIPVSAEADIIFGGDVKYEVAPGVSVGVGLKSLTPYVTAAVESKLAEAILFFADVKIPVDNSGADFSGGLKVQW